MAKRHKVMTVTATDQNKPKIVTALFATGAGPNLLWKDVVPTPWMKRIQPVRASIRAAGDTTLTVEGIVRLQGKICKHVTTAVFSGPLKFVVKDSLGPLPKTNRP